MSGSYTWDQVDRLAAEWYELPAQGNEARRKSMEEKLFCAVLELLGDPKKTNQRDLTDALGEFWLTDWKRFDPSLSPMSHFLRSRLKLRAVDVERRDNDVHRKVVEGETVSVRSDSLDDEERWEKNCNLEDPKGEAELQDLFLDETVCECLALFLNLRDRLSGKAKNDEKINYYRLFFTNGVTYYIRSNPAQTFFAHERELFQAMKIPFLDYLLVQVCRTVPAIACSDGKLYGQLADNRPMEPVRQPLPNDVYTTYLRRVENRSVGESAVSQQMTAYRKLRNFLC